MRGLDDEPNYRLRGIVFWYAFAVFTPNFLMYSLL